MNRRPLQPIFIALAVITIILAGVGFFVVRASQQNSLQNSDSGVVSPTLPTFPGTVPMSKQVIGGDLRVTGKISAGGIVLRSSEEPLVAGQLYLSSDNQLHYFNGSTKTNISSIDSIAEDVAALKQARSGGVLTLQGRAGEVTLSGGGGIAVDGTTIRNTGVLTLQGVAGNVTLAGGNGISVSGTTITNDGVTSIGGIKGNLGIGSGLSAAGGTLVNTGMLSLVSGSSDLVVTSDSSGNYTISDVGSGAGGTVALGPVAAQDDPSTNPSIWINKTGSGNLLQLSTGVSPVNRFVVDSTGAILTGSIGFNQVTGKPTFINSFGGTTGDLLLGTGLGRSGQTINNTGTLSVGGLSGAITLGSGLAVSGGQLVATASGVGSITGTPNQVIVSGTDNVTLSLPQDIAVNSTPTFGGLNLSSALGVGSGGTGATTAAGARTNLGAAASGVNNDITQLTGLTAINPAAALSIGATGQNLTLQGASTTLSANAGGFSTNLTFAAPTANVIYRLQTAAAGTYDVCTTYGNCAGVGGGVTSPGGTVGKLSKFISGSSIGDSIITDDGTSVSIAGALNVNTITPTAAAIFGATTQSLALQGSNTTITSTNLGVTNTLSFATPSGANKSIVIPNASGTIAVSAAGPLSLDANGNLTCPSCLTDGSGGGSAGVSSLNSLTGDLTLTGITAGSILTSGSTITVQDASATTKGLASFNSTNLTVTGGAVNTVQNISVSSTPSFAGLSLTGPNSLTLGSATNVGGLLFRDGSSAFTNTLSAGTYSANRTIAVPDASGTLAVSATGNIALSVNGQLSFTGTLPVNSGGTGSTTAGGARTNLGAAASGANSDITSLLGLTTALSVAQGGTGTSNFTQNGVVVGQGTSGLATVTASGAGECLMSTAGAPVFQACPGGGGVESLNGATGAITLAGTAIGSVSTVGGAITINDASTTTKGLASFNSSNFSVTAGDVDTIQGISTTSSPLFNALSLTNALSVGNGGTGLTSAALNGQLLIGNGTGYSLNTLTAGTGITISNTAGAITLSSPGSGTCASCASQSLSNLAGVAINTSLLPGVSNTIDVGSGSLLFRAGYFGGALQAASIDTPATGTFTIGGTNATSVNINQNTVLAANKTLTVTGGSTANRPASPTEGMIYFDTTTKQLVTYANAKWQSDRSTATKIVSDASTSPNTDAADYVVPAGSTSAQTTINAAINALPASGGVVYLMEGTYNIDASIVLKSSVTLAGAGTSSTIRVKNAFDNSLNMFTNADTTNGNFRVTLKDIRLDGNSTNQTNGNQKIAAFTKVGTGTGATAVPGIKINRLMAEGFGRGGSAITFTTSNNNVISDSTFMGLRDPCNCTDIITFTGDNNLITGSQFINGGTTGATVKTTGNSNAVSNNLFDSNTGSDITVSGQNASVTGNQIVNNQYHKGITLSSASYSNISNNNLSFSGGSNNAAISGTTSSNNVISGNTMKDIFNFGISLTTNSNDNTVTDNTISGQGTGIYISGSTGGKINNNTIPSMANTGVGISLSGTTRMAISGNSVTAATLTGIVLASGSNENILSDNKLHNNGDTGANDSIQIASSNSNSIIGNHITDTAGTGYAINITSSASSTNYLSNNRFSGTGATSIQDLGTGTTYANQARGTNGTQLTVRTVNDPNAFQIQNTLGTSFFNADSTNMRISVGAVGGFSDTVSKVADPATLPTGSSYGTAFSPDGQYMGIAHDTSPFITIYKRSGDTFTKLANPTVLPTGNARGVVFSPDGQYMTVAHTNAPYITIYKRSGDTFTKLADPATLPTSTGNSTAFSPDGQYMSVAHGSSPHITIYKRSGDTFTKLANPATLPTGTGTGTAFSPDGQYMTVSHAVAPYISIYKRSGDTFTKLADPATLPTAQANATAFSPDGQYMSVAHYASPYISIYKRSGDTFTKLANPATLPLDPGFSVAFSLDGQYMTVGNGTSNPSIRIYKRSGDTFTAQGSPSPLPGLLGYGVAFSPDGQYMSVASGNSPYLTIYKGTGGALSRLELASGTTADEGLAFGKELKVYRSAPGILSLAAGGSLNLEGGNLTLKEGNLEVGGSGLFKNITDSTNALQVQSAVGASLFNADTANMRISVGNVGGFSDAPSKLANPATLPVNTTQGTAFSPDGQYMSVAHGSSPYVTIYKRSGDTFTKLADPAILPTGYSVATAFSPDGQYMSVAHQTSPFITIYKRSGDNFTKLANPAVLPTSTGTGTAFSPDGQYMSVTHSASPFITIYKRSGDTFTKLANPASLPAGYSQGTAFSPDGQYMTVSHDISPFITIYKRSGDTFTKLANPASLPTGTGKATAFSPDGQYMSVAHDMSPYITIYKRSGDTFTKLADPASLPTGTGNGTAFSPDGQYMTVGHATAPYITIYKRSGDTFTKLANPASLPTGNSYSTAFSPDGQYMSVAHATSPFVTIYKGAGGAAARMELASGTTAEEGLAFGKELKVYRSAPGVLSLAAGGSFNIDGGNLNVQGGAYFAGNVGIGATASGSLLSVGALTTADASAQLAVSTGAAGNKGLVIQGVASQTGDLLQAQNSTGAVLAKIDASGNLTVQNATFTGTLTVNGHIITGGSTPTIAAGTAACTTPTVSVSGNDTSGTVTITTGTGCAATGTMATITFNAAFGAAPRVTLTASNGNATNLKYYSGTSTTTTFTVDTTVAPVDSTTYTFTYLTVQ